MKTAFRREFAALLLLAALTAYFLRKALFAGGGVVPGSPVLLDLTNQFYPWRLFGFGMLKRGIVPLWNPYLLCGYPFVANWQSAMFYPPNALFLALPVGAALSWCFALHVFLSGVCVYAYMRLLVGDRIPSLVAALAFMFSAPVVLRIFAGHVTVVCAMAWFPLELLAIEQGMRSRRALWFAAGGAAFAMQLLSGQPQYAFYSALAALLYGAGRCVMLARRERSAAPVARCGAGFALIAAVAAGLAAVQILPGLELARHSSRLAMTYRDAAGASFPPENAGAFLVPELFGDFLGVRYWGRSFLWEVCPYVGILPLALACLGALAPGDGRPRLLAAVGAFFFVIALGAYTPLLKFLYERVPGFNMIRGSAKAVFVTSFCISFLAGYGCREVMREGGGALRGRLAVWVLLAAGAVFLASLLAFPAFRASLWGALLRYRATRVFEGWNAPHPGDAAGSALLLSVSMRGFRRALIMGLAALWALSFRPRRRGSRAAAALLIAAATVADLWSFGGRYIMVSPESCCWWPRGVASFFAERPGVYRILRDGRLFSPGVNQGMNDRLSTYCGYETNQVALYSGFSAFFGIRSEDAASLLRRPAMSGVLSLANIRYFIVPPAAPAAGYILRYEGDGVRIYENPGVLPRAFVVHRALVSREPRSDLALMRAHVFDPAETVVLDGEPGLALSGGGVAAAEITRYEPCEVAVRCRLSEPGILVLGDIYYPGWTASVDGKPGRILRADHAFRAVPLEKGEHEVRFTYAPASFRVGAWASAGTAAAVGLWCAGAGMCALRRRRRHA